MGKLTRQLCMILALGLAIGLPGLASVSHADLVGPTFSSGISFYSGGEPWNTGYVTSSSEGTISHNGTVVTITPTSINVQNTVENYASYGQLSWSRPGVSGWADPTPPDTIVNLSFDYTIVSDLTDSNGNPYINEWNTYVDVAWNTNAGTFHDAEPGTHHFAQTFVFSGPSSGSLFVQAFASDGDQVTISNLSVSTVSAVPLPPTMLLLGSGLFYLAAYGRRRMKG